MVLRIISAIVVAALLAWSGYWFYASRVQLSIVENIFAQMRATGYEASYADIRVSGFPNRFDVTIDEPQLRDPTIGYAWKAPFLQIFSLSYQPYRFIIAFPEQQLAAVGSELIQIVTTEMKASLSLEFADASQLGTFILEASLLRADGQSGWNIHMSDILAAIRHGGQGEYDILFRTNNSSDQTGTSARSNSDDGLQSFSMDIGGTLKFNQPLNAEPCEGTVTQLESITLTNAQVSRNDAALFMSGRIDFANGLSNGNLVIRPGDGGFAAVLNSLPPSYKLAPISIAALQQAARLADLISNEHELVIENGDISLFGVPLMTIQEFSLCPKHFV